MTMNLKFNRLTVLGFAELKVYPSGTKKQVTAICDCGVIGTYVLAALKNGNTKSCGCYNRELISSHGMYKTRQYQTWADMKNRCDNLKHKWYPEYGGRGISYSPNWVSFECFWEDMKGGYGDNLTLDRIDNEGDYTFDNCRWAAASLQNHNQRKPRDSSNKFIGVKIAKSCNNISALIKRSGISISLGSYKTEESAAKAYDDASEIIYGDRPNKTTSENDWIFTQIQRRLQDHTEGKSFRCKGSNFSHAVLDENSAVEIFKMANSGEYTQKQIAEKYGVDQSSISAIKRGVSWVHATENIKIPVDTPSHTS